MANEFTSQLLRFVRRELKAIFSRYFTRGFVHVMAFTITYHGRNTGAVDGFVWQVMLQQELGGWAAADIAKADYEYFIEHLY